MTKVKFAKIDAIVADIAEKVLSDFFEGKKSSTVELDDSLKLSELKEIRERVQTLKHMVYTKENGVKNIVTKSVKFAVKDDAFNLIVVSK